MEASCSLMEETTMDFGVASTRAKSKTALNRRPSGYWKVFSNWWRGRYAALKTRPTVTEVIEWYHQNAASSWPAGQVPCLKAVLRQSKGLRPIDGLKEYFREYRKKRKQQGGLALKACEDGSQCRSRAVKRRRGRAAHKDSSDEEDIDEMEHEPSLCSEPNSSDEDDDEEVEEIPRRRQRRAASATIAAVGVVDAEVATVAGEADVVEDLSPPRAEADTEAAADSAAGDAGPDDDCRFGTMHIVFDAWHEVSVPETDAAGAMALVSCLPLLTLAADSTLITAGFPCAEAIDDDSDEAFMPLADATLAAAAAAAAGDQVHPAVADGMVPIASSGSPHTTAGPRPHTLVTCSLAPLPYVSYVPVVAVARSPLRFTAVRARCGIPVGLPPLSNAARAASTLADGAAATASAAALSKSRSEVQSMSANAAKHDNAAVVQDDDLSGDRCSTDGGFPTPCDTRIARPYMHEGMYDGSGFEYVAYGPPPPFACHPPPSCCYRSSPYPMVPYPYQPVSSASYPAVPNCSGSGCGATSSFSPAAPWPSMASHPDGNGSFTQRQPNLESTAHLDACYAPPHHHHHQHHLQTWGHWVPADGTTASAAWHSTLPPCYSHEAAWGRRSISRSSLLPFPCGYGTAEVAPMGCCSCGACPDSVPLHSVVTPCQNPPVMRPTQFYPCYVYGNRYNMLPYVSRPDAWTVTPPRDTLDGCGGEGEACSSSVSEQDGQEHGRWSPCSGTSAQPSKPSCMSPSAAAAVQPHWARSCGPQPFTMVPHGGRHTELHHGCSPLAMHPYARGMATAGSVTSMPSLAAVHEDSPIISSLGVFKVGTRSCTDMPAAPASCNACDVLPYLADGPSPPGSATNSTAAKLGMVDAEAEASPEIVPTAHGDANASGLEVTDCGLGLGDGFGVGARDTMDQDLVFAFENFVACATPFDALACH